MLQTRHKDRLPQRLSYPVGLQDLDKVLGDISQAAQLELRFSACPFPAYDTYFRSLVNRNLPYQVLEARFEKWDKRPSLGRDTLFDDYLRGQWSLRVFPVASVLRSRARASLIDALPSVREWFVRTRPESWYHGRKVCECRFEPLAGTIEVKDIVETT